VLRTLDCLHDVPIKYVTSTTGSRDSHGTHTHTHTHTQCQVSYSWPVVEQHAKKHGNRAEVDTIRTSAINTAPNASKHAKGSGV
jgi:hypothetical protein